MSSATLKIALFGVSLLLGAAGKALAQNVQREQIAVDVRDTEGAPVEGAEVTLRPVQGDETYETQAVGAGEYRGEVPLQHLNDRYEVLVDAGPRGEGTGKAQWWGVGTVMRVRVELGPTEDDEDASRRKSSEEQERLTDLTTEESSGDEKDSSRDGEERGACTAVTVPESWVATSSGRKGRAHELRGQTYRVRTYMAPVLEDGGEKLTNDNSALTRIPTRAAGPSRLQDDTPISSKAELLTVMGHVMNTDAPVSRGGRFLSVDHPVEWDERANGWRTIRQEAFDPEDGKIASALLLGGKLLRSVGVSMAIGDLSGLSTAVTATDFAINLGSTTLNYFESITATPKDKSLAPAMRALGDLDSERQRASYRKTLDKVQAREYLNRYMDISSDAAEIADALMFAADEWSNVSTAIQNYRAAQEPIIAGTRMQEIAIGNAYHFFGAAAMGAAEKVVKGRLLGGIENLSSGVNRYLFTANFYLTVLEAYARLLDERKQKVARPESFDRWSAYSEALSRYQYRVALYHEVRLGLMTNLYQYSNRLNDMGYEGDEAIPDMTIERYKGLMNEQRETYEAIVEEISTQMQVLDAVEEGYPDFGGQDCLADNSANDSADNSTGPSDDKDARDEDAGDEDAGDEDPPSSGVTSETRGQNDPARANSSDESVKSSGSVEMFGAGPRRAGVHEGPGPEPPVEEKWAFDTGAAVESSPAVVGGTVYVGSDDGHVYAIDAESGQEQWAFNTGDFVESSPAVADGTVYVGSDDGHVYAIDAESGQEQWAFDTGLSVNSSPAVAGGTVYVGSDDGHVYAIDAESGQEQWAFNTGDFVESSPAVAGGTVYVGRYDDRLYAIDAESGQEQWAVDTGADVNSSPAVASGTVYVGSDDGRLYAIDVETGQEQWAFNTGAEVNSSPAVAGGTVYFRSYDDRLYAIEAESGEEQWAVDIGLSVASSPAVVGGTVYVGSYDDRLYAIEAESGEEQWAVDIGLSVASSPAVVGGTLYVGNNDGYVYAIDSESD